jgi:hypothetical protein
MAAALAAFGARFSNSAVKTCCAQRHTLSDPKLCVQVQHLSVLLPTEKAEQTERCKKCDRLNADHLPNQQQEKKFRIIITFF